MMHVLTPERPRSFLRVTWVVHYKCNYNCPYCYQRSSSLFTPYENFKYDYSGIVIGIKNNILLQNEEKVDLYITGGEFSLLPLENLKHLLSELLSTGKVNKIHMITNLFRPITYYKDLVETFPGTKFDFDVSLHEMETNYLEFISKAKELKLVSNINRVSVQFPVNNDTSDDVMDALEKSGIDYKYLAENERLKLKDTSKIKRDAFKKVRIDGELVDVRKVNNLFKNFTDKVCSATCIRVMPNGDVNFIGCPTRYSHKIGNVYVDKIKYDKDGWRIPCQEDYCYFCHIRKVEFEGDFHD